MIMLVRLVVTRSLEQIEEAVYWLGLAMPGKYPRRILTAWRLLLTEPRTREVRS